MHENSVIRHAGITLRALPGMARFALRCAPADAPRASQALGLDLPLAALTASAGAGRAALWLGPDEWLILAEDGAAETLPPAMEDAFAATPFSLVEISGRQLAYSLSGPGAEEVLAEGCPLDLSDAAFGPGSCTRTLFGKVEMVLWRPGPEPAWHIEVWRSFAPHLHAHLREALLDL